MTTFTGTLHPHQEQGLSFLLAQDRALLADEVGLGKTVQAAAAIGCLLDSGELTRTSKRLRTLWVTTSSLVPQTVAELQRFLPTAAVAESLTGVRGTSADRQRMEAFLRQHPQGPDVLVTTHGLAHERRQHFEAMHPQLVVIDEASALKGHGARHEALKDVCDRADRAIAMTATPMENDPLEFWALLDLIDIPGLPDKETYSDWYCDIATFPDGKTKCMGWKTWNSAQAVMEGVGPHYLRRTAAGVGLQLPQKVDSGVRLVPLTPVQADEYQRATYISHALVRHNRLKKISRRGSDGQSHLIPTAVHEIIQLVRAGNKVVVYAEHLDDVDAIGALLIEAEIGFVSLRGENDKDERRDAVDQFHEDPAIPVLVGTSVLEHGLNLQFANALVSVGQTYNPGRERQREGRLCRLGSPNRTFRHLVFLPDTDLTRRQIATLERKEVEAAPIYEQTR